MRKVTAHRTTGDLKRSFKEIAELLAAEADRLPRGGATATPNGDSRFVVRKLVPKLRAISEALLKERRR